MSMDDDDPEQNDGSDELRAKDLLRLSGRSRAELEEAMDPETLAQLESWFDMPNLAAAEEQQAIVEEQVAEDKELAARLERIAAACAASDPAFIAHIERHKGADIRHTPAFELAPIVDERLVNPAVRATLDRQFAEEPIADLRSYEQPRDIDEIIAKHNAPQAILRDLYRPVTEYEKRMESPFSEEDLPSLDALREVREALRERLAVEWTEPALPSAVRARVAGSAILKQPWSVLWEAVEQLKKERGY
ncbi:MAG TPA: hypothetical protein VM261_17895 [Kofleriaceae bacterium]|nr:hypothetical protein [Kofleriaceae bacterium]